jgi:hypothetical protein
MAPKKPATKAPKTKPPTNRAAGRVKAKVLEIVRHIYGDQGDDAKLVAFDPNDVDAPDPAMLYELLGEVFAVEADGEESFGGFGGTVAETIAFIASRWDGKTVREVELPPPLRAGAAPASKPAAAAPAGPRFFRLWAGGAPDHPERAIVRAPPTNVDAEAVARLGRGQPVAIAVPDLAIESGDQLTPLLGNTLGWLIVDQQLLAFIKQHGRCVSQDLRAVLRDAAGKMVSESYTVVNPLEPYDCVDAKASDFDPTYDPARSGTSWASGLVFRRSRMASAPGLFRIPEDPTRLFVGLDFMLALKAANLMGNANVLVIEEIPLR